MQSLVLSLGIKQAYAADAAAAFGKAIDPIIQNIVLPVVFVVFALAVLVFAYGVLKMVFNATDSEEHTRGRWSMLGGVIGMFIMLSAWGIIYFVSGTVKDIANGTDGSRDEIQRPE